MSSRFVKICGITNVVDAVKAEEFGADILGFVFSIQSPRTCSLPVVKEVQRRSPNLNKVIVFGYDSYSYIENIVKRFYNDTSIFFQLSKNHPYFNEFVECYTKERVIPVIHVESRLNSNLMSNFIGHPYVILDSKKKSSTGEIIPGGTGECFDWSYLEDIKEPFILAGGLNTKNIKQALKMMSENSGFDVSSGIERKLGVKNIYKLKKFITAIKSYK